MRFHALVQLNGKTATGIQVPEDVVASLGSSKRPAVRVTIKGYTYRSTVATMGGQYMLPVSAEVREKVGIAAGDEIDVDLEFDNEPREVVVPPDFAEALDRDPDAKRVFSALSYSHQRQHVLAIEEAKSAETRQRRITKAITMLRESQR